MPSKVTPKDFFFWAGAMIALYGSVISFIMLVFQYIDYAFPDPLAYYAIDPYSSGMRFAMASLIVLVPVAIVLMRFIRADIVRSPEKNDLWVRRWALVLTVFIAGAAVVGDLIALINSFLGGDLTTPFLLKVAILLLVAGAAFLHFLADLRGYWSAQPQRAQMVGYGAGAVVILTIIAGFFIMGSPSQMRFYRFDSQKVSDLQNIQWQIINYWQQKQILPDDVAAIEDPIAGWVLPVDSQGDPYVYRYEKTGARSFKLCATFNTESRESRSQVAKPYPIDGENWQHGSGDVCFERTIDPDRYPPYPKGIPVRE